MQKVKLLSLKSKICLGCNYNYNIKRLITKTVVIKFIKTEI